MLQYDFLVIGSGIGGLGFALKAAENGTVAVVCKETASFTNTAFAQGGISAVTTAADSVAQHIQDTLKAGAGLCNEEMVKLLAEEAPTCIQELLNLGVNFTRSSTGNLDLGREGGHSQNRIIHTHDHTGFSIQQALLKAVKDHPKITLLENHFAVDLLLDEQQQLHRRCVGAQVLNKATNNSFAISAKAVMLASGGIGQIFQHTTNPAVATGDGIAMAARAGAAVQDMEFVQFHPTALYDPEKPTFLISEAVRGFGAELKRPDGTPFMHLYHELGSLAPRDVVSRAIQEQMQQSDSPFVYLNLRHLPADEIKARFPKIYARCQESNLDMATDLIPVVPAAHYLCGGIKTDAHGRTTVPGLYACGEAARTGIHGANRLASNSLPEAWIFAKRAAAHAAKFIQKITFKTQINNYLIADYQLRENLELDAHHFFEPLVSGAEINSFFDQIPENQSKNMQDFCCIVGAEKVFLRYWMWEYAGIVRTKPGLHYCHERLLQQQQEVRQLLQNTTPDVALLELNNMVQVALLIVKAALKREQSVGCHFVSAAAEHVAVA